MLASQRPNQQREDGARGRRGVGRDSDVRDGVAVAGGHHRAARVEPEPAKPQDEHAEDHEAEAVAGNRVHFAFRPVLAEARADHDGAAERDPPADGVHHGGAGEVEHAAVTEDVPGRQRAAAPDPVPGDRVDHE
jgi:hypothetical protein